MAALERGSSVPDRTSKGYFVSRLVLAVVIGAALLSGLILIVIVTIEQGGDWRLLLLYVRLWGWALGIVACLVVAPWWFIRRMRRADSLIIMRRGIVETRADVVQPKSFIGWDEIQRVEFERRRAWLPRVLSLRLTEEAAHARGTVSAPRRTLLVKGGFTSNERQLSRILTAVHARFASEQDPRP